MHISQQSHPPGEGRSHISWEKLRSISSLVYSNLPKEKRASVGVTFGSLVVDCKYKGKTCTEDHFQPYLHPSLINCFTFQANRTDVPGKLLSGPYNGLSLILRSTPNINYMPNWFDPMQNLESIRLAIHAPGTVPFMTKKALNLEAGKLTLVSLMMKSYERLGSPFKDCNTKMLFDLDSRTFEASADVCREKCMIENIQRNCNCTSVLFEDLTKTDYPYCSGLDNISPLEFEKRSDCENSLTQGEGNVDCRACIWDCQELDYDLQTTFAEWPHPSKIDGIIYQHVRKTGNHSSRLWKRLCSDPILSFYILLMKKANITQNICPENDTRSNNKLPYSMMNISNIISSQHPGDYNYYDKFDEIVAEIMGTPGFPGVYQYTMDVPSSYYEVKNLKELNAKWVKESFYQVNIYFRQTSVEQHFQEGSFSFADLCSSIGKCGDI